MTEIVRVLVVDDSAYVRKVVRQILSRSPFIEVVGAARDGKEALEMVEQVAAGETGCSRHENPSLHLAVTCIRRPTSGSVHERRRRSPYWAA